MLDWDDAPAKPSQQPAPPLRAASGTANGASRALYTVPATGPAATPLVPEPGEFTLTSP
ncbi:MAG: hypothetical protein JOY51_08880, partial [Nevskia sp.]|nr:hypothetical protein [Nevskia sp.]